MTTFVVGQRVKLSVTGIKWLYCPKNRRYPHDEFLRGTVTHVDELVSVRLDGRKKASSYHKSFWTRAND